MDRIAKYTLWLLLGFCLFSIAYAVWAQDFPGSPVTNLVDGRWDEPGSAWAYSGAPALADIDMGAPRLIAGVTVLPFTGVPGNTYFYAGSWSVKWVDGAGVAQDFTSVQMLTGAGTLLGPGVSVTDGDPGTGVSDDAYKFYKFTFDPVSTQRVLLQITEGDVDGDSNAAELEIHPAWYLGNLVQFSASADDEQDGDVSASIVWSSDLDGSIGAGPDVDSDTLSVGLHRITATATNSLAMEGEGEVEVLVVDPGT